jgi:hypothetical protein
MKRTKSEQRTTTLGGLWRQRRALRFSLVVGAAICVLFFTQCEVRTGVAISDENPPVFRLSGSGSLVFFAVFEEINNNDRNPRTLWKIKSKRPIWISQVPPITYGQVPEGFVQMVPETGDQPEPLVEGHTYAAGGPASEAPGGYSVFAMRGGRPAFLRSFGI